MPAPAEAFTAGNDREAAPKEAIMDNPKPHYARGEGALNCEERDLKPRSLRGTYRSSSRTGDTP